MREYDSKLVLLDSSLWLVMPSGSCFFPVISYHTFVRVCGPLGEFRDGIFLSWEVVKPALIAYCYCVCLLVNRVE